MGIGKAGNPDVMHNVDPVSTSFFSLENYHKNIYL